VQIKYTSSCDFAAYFLSSTILTLTTLFSVKTLVSETIVFSLFSSWKRMYKNSVADEILNRICQFYWTLSYASLAGENHMLLFTVGKFKFKVKWPRQRTEEPEREFRGNFKQMCAILALWSTGGREKIKGLSAVGWRACNVAKPVCGPDFLLKSISPHTTQKKFVLKTRFV
jgi:hypothetical protein